MGHDVQIDELLSAYLTGDVTSAERAAVEQRLANSPALQNELAELQALAALLKQAQRPVTAKMLAELKRRVAQATPQSSELLAAAITGDATPAERAAVEQWLAQNSQARGELASLQAFSQFLKQAQRPVTPELLAQLQRRVVQATPQASELLAAAVSGEVTPAERAAVEGLLAKDSRARRELASLQALSNFLKQAEVPIPKNVGRSLAERLSGKLPAAALAPVLPSAEETVAIKLRTSAPTVRIYAVQESPWRKRILRASAAIAAALLFAAGAIFGMRALKPDADHGVAEAEPRRTTAADQSVSASTGTSDDGSGVSTSAKLDETVPGTTNRAPVIPPAPPQGIGDSSDVSPAPSSPNTQPPQATPNTQEAPPAPRQTPPAMQRTQRNPGETSKTTDVTPNVLPDSAHNTNPNPDAPIEPNPKTVDPSRGMIPYAPSIPGTGNGNNGNGGGAPNTGNTGTPNTTPPNSTAPNPTTAPNTTNNNGNGTTTSTALTDPSKSQTVPPPQTTQGGGGQLVPFSNPPTVAPNAEPTPPTPPPATNSFIAAVDDKLVAAVLRGNDAAALLPDGTQQTIQLKDQLPSGAVITAGNTQLLFVLPGDGRLWVNSHTKVTVQLKGLNTLAALDSGEISYRAPHGGNITVTSGSVQANTTGLMDVALDDTQGTMTVYSFDGTTRVTRKGKPAINLNKQHNEVILKLDLSDSPTPQSGPAGVLLWQQDLNVNGETGDGFAPNSKNEKSRNRHR